MTTSVETDTQDTQANERAPSADQNRDQGGCCGGPAPKGAEACCARDAQVKSEGGTGCGCAPRTASRAQAPTRCC